MPLLIESQAPCAPPSTSNYSCLGCVKCQVSYNKKIKTMQIRRNPNLYCNYYYFYYYWFRLCVTLGLFCSIAPSSSARHGACMYFSIISCMYISTYYYTLHIIRMIYISINKLPLNVLRSSLSCMIS